MITLLIMGFMRSQNTFETTQVSRRRRNPLIGWEISRGCRAMALVAL